MERQRFEVILAASMAVVGSLNTLCETWSHKLNFSHIFFQAECLFIGEFLCLVVFLFSKCCCKHLLKQELTEDLRNEQTRRRQRIERLIYQQQIRQRSDADCDDGVGYDIQEEIDELKREPDEPKLNPFIFLPAALFDILSTGVMYMGLNLTFWSSAQMLRGALILFTALLSVAFLGRKTKLFEWLAIFFILGGLLVVGGGDFKLHENKNIKPNGIVAGDLLIVMALIILAVRMVYEERFVNRYNVHPLLGVGLEGMFGILILGVLLVPFYYINVGTFSADNANRRLEDVRQALCLIKNDRLLLVSVVGNIVTYGVYSFIGLSVTKSFHAKTRVIFDSQKYLIVWLISLGLGWKHYHYLQIIGYILLITGMLIYWRLLTCERVKWLCCLCRRRPPKEANNTNEVERPMDPDETRPLLAAEGSIFDHDSTQEHNRQRNSVI